MEALGTALGESRPEKALEVIKTSLALNRRYWSHDENAIILTQNKLANCLHDVGRDDDALLLMREVYAKAKASRGSSDDTTILCGSNLCGTLLRVDRFRDARHLALELIPAARRLESSSPYWLNLTGNLTSAAICDPCITTAELRQTIDIMDDAIQTARRLLGPAHPLTKRLEKDLEHLRELMEAYKAGGA